MKNFLLLGTVLGLAACASTVDEPEAVTPEAVIADAVDRAARANQAVAEVEVAVAAPTRPAPGQTVPQGVKLPPEITQPITVDWQGRIEPLLQSIAARAGYDFNVIGRPPANPVMLTLAVEDETLYDVVRQAGNLVHESADVAMNPASRIIELRYGG